MNKHLRHALALAFVLSTALTAISGIQATQTTGKIPDTRQVGGEVPLSIKEEKEIAMSAAGNDGNARSAQDWNDANSGDAPVATPETSTPTQAELDAHPATVESVGGQTRTVQQDEKQVEEPMIPTYIVKVSEDSVVYDSQRESVLFTVKQNDVLVVVNETVNADGIKWIKVLLNDGEGWINRDSLEKTAKGSTRGKAVKSDMTLMVMNKSAYVKKSENADSENIAIARKGCVIAVMGETESYYKVCLFGGIGYVNKALVDEYTVD